MSWIPSDPAPVIMERVELAPGHRLGQVPCTRNIYFDPNKLPPEVPRDILPEMVPETLLYFDEEARFIYYNMEGTKRRSEEHTSELQSLMRISYAVFCLKKKKNKSSDRI